KDLVRLQGGTVHQTVAVDNIRYWEAQNSVRVVVDITGDITFTQGDAKDPDRVFIDLSPARLNSALIGKQWPVKSGLLQQIRVGQYDASTVRVVLDVGTVGRVTSFTLRDPDRLIIDVLGKEAANNPLPPGATNVASTAVAVGPQPAAAAPQPSEIVAAAPKPTATSTASTTSTPSTKPVEKALANTPVTTTSAPPPVQPAAAASTDK